MTSDKIKLTKEAEERLQPMMAAADKAARHFIANIALMKLALEHDGSEAFNKAADEAQDAFSSAIVKGFMLCIAHGIESGYISDTVINTTEAAAYNADTEGK